MVMGKEKLRISLSPVSMNSEIKEKKKKISPSLWVKLVTESYESLEETDEIIVDGDEFISFTKSFKYLGTIFPFDFNDEEYIGERIKKTNQSMPELNFFWDADQIDVKSKYLIYSTIPLKLLFLGYESWALTNKLGKKLEDFHFSHMENTQNKVEISN